MLKHYKNNKLFLKKVQKLISKIYIFALLLTFCEIANSNEYEFLTSNESSNKTNYQIFGINSSGTQSLLNNI